MIPSFPVRFEAVDDDLAALCAARPLVTTEHFAPNAFYGHDRIVKAYARWPDDRPLKVALPHGVEYSAIPVIRKRERVPVNAHYIDDPETIYAAHRSRRTWPMASPFEYLCELQASLPAPPRRGTIFFPAHSWGYEDMGIWGTAVYDADRLADELAALGAEHQPVSVCMYWLDYNLGRHRAFERRGLRIVSAGHRHDPMFLVRLLHLCREHRFAAANIMGSHVFYAIRAGCHYFECGAPASVEGERISAAGLERDRVTGPAILSRIIGASSAAQRAIADDFLGTRNLVPPETLAALLRRAERLDCLGLCRHDRGHGEELVVSGPWWMARKAHDLARGAAGAAARLRA